MATKRTNGLIPALLLAGLLFTSSSSAPPKKLYPGNPKPPELDVPNPDADVVLCEFNVGDYVLPDGTVGDLVTKYATQPASMYGAVASDTGSPIYAWAVAGMIAAIRILDGKQDSRWPLCWGAGVAPPQGWTREEWAAALATRDLFWRVANEPATVGWKLPNITAGATTWTPGSVAAAALSRTPEQIRYLSLATDPPPGASYVNPGLTVDALVFIVYRAAITMYSEIFV